MEDRIIEEVFTLIKEAESVGERRKKVENEILTTIDIIERRKKEREYTLYSIELYDLGKKIRERKVLLKRILNKSIFI